MLSVSLPGCTTKPEPKTSDDDRGCYVGLVPEAASLVWVWQWAPKARPGDVLITRACLDQQHEAAMNDVRRMLR